MNYVEEFMNLLDKDVIDENDEKQLAICVSNVVNNLTFKPEDIYNQLSIPEKENLKEISYSWIAKASSLYDLGLYDGRNEYSFNLANKIYEYLKDSVSFPVHLAFCNAMAKEHRTLQQSFTGFVLYYLFEYDNTISKVITKLGIENNIICIPLI